jgi:hypothetical protein
MVEDQRLESGFGEAPLGQSTFSLHQSISDNQEASSDHPTSPSSEEKQRTILSYIPDWDCRWCRRYCICPILDRLEEISKKKQRKRLGLYRLYRLQDEEASLFVQQMECLSRERTIQTTAPMLNPTLQKRSRKKHLNRKMKAP